MKVKFQYTDFTEWEGHPSTAADSPDKGVVRMVVYDDFGYELQFTYDDLYYFYEVVNGGWLFGSGSPKREFVIKPGQKGTVGNEIPIILPAGTIIRHGETVSQEDAVLFGLIETADEKILHVKEFLPVIEG